MSDTAEKLFRDVGALLEGHFLLTSGRHSGVYWEKFHLLQHPRQAVELCAMIAEHFRDMEVDVVAGPTTGGVILAFEVARQLGLRAAYAERTADGRGFPRGVGPQPGDRVLIVDDIVTTGGSVLDVVRAVESSQSRVVGIGVLVDRADEPADFSVPYYSCLRAPATSYPATECPLCQAGIPLTRIGGDKKLS